MALDIKTYLARIQSGDFSRTPLEISRIEAIRKGVAELLTACDDAVSDETSNSTPSSREIGIKEAAKELDE